MISITGLLDYRQTIARVLGTLARATARFVLASTLALAFVMPFGVSLSFALFLS